MFSGRLYKWRKLTVDCARQSGSFRNLLHVTEVLQKPVLAQLSTTKILHY